MAEYIERGEVMQAFSDFVWNSNHSDIVPAPQWNHAVEIVRDIPAADVVEVRPGKWIEENTRLRSSQFCCSECHRTAYDPQPTRLKDWKKRCRYAYCPNCGAKMTEDHREQKE